LECFKARFRVSLNPLDSVSSRVRVFTDCTDCRSNPTASLYLNYEQYARLQTAALDNGSLLDSLPAVAGRTLHLQIKKRSENLGRVQAGVFGGVVNGPRFPGTPERVNLLAAAGQGGGTDRLRCWASGCSGLLSAKRAGVGSSSITSASMSAVSFAMGRTEANFHRRVFDKDDVLPARQKIAVQGKTGSVSGECDGNGL